MGHGDDGDVPEGNQDVVFVGKTVPLLLTTREAAAFCMISESNFYKLARKGYVPKPVRIGTLNRWRKSDLVEWVAAGCPRNWKGESNNGTQE